MRILLATDGSEQSEAMLNEIVRRPFPANSELRIISVVDAPMPLAEKSLATSSGYHGELEKIELKRARTSVKDAALRLRKNAEGRSLSVTTEVFSGSPKRVILEEAEKFGADLIIVGSHGHGMLERFLLGSVSQTVALHAKCSVEIVRTAQTKVGESK